MKRLSPAMLPKRAGLNMMPRASFAIDATEAPPMPLARSEG